MFLATQAYKVLVPIFQQSSYAPTLSLSLSLRQDLFRAHTMLLLSLSGIRGASCPNMGWASESKPMCTATLEAGPVGGAPTAPGVLHMPDEMLSSQLF